MLKKMDNRLKVWLWFFFQPEDSSIPGPIVAARRCISGHPAGSNHLHAVLKSTVWIILSIFVSLTLAQLD
jgi:hypothetical protein